MLPLLGGGLHRQGRDRQHADSERGHHFVTVGIAIPAPAPSAANINLAQTAKHGSGRAGHTGTALYRMRTAWEDVDVEYSMAVLRRLQAVQTVA